VGGTAPGFGDAIDGQEDRGVACAQWTTVAVDSERFAVAVIAVRLFVQQECFLLCHVLRIGTNRVNHRTVVKSDS
jgi:hypothetical protein